MTDTLTTAKSLTVQTIGGNANTWGAIANANFTAIDQALGQTLTKAISGNTTLIANEAVYVGYEFTGALTADATITFPTFRGPFFVRNKTTGGHALILGMATGATVTVPTLADAVGFSDGTDFFLPGAAPTGSAGGDLSGTYPNPTVAKIAGSTPAAVATSGSASDLTVGTLATARLPTVDVIHGGSGATTQAAAFANIAVLASTLSSPGYIKFANGLVVQWGFVTLSGVASQAVSFPISFPNNFFSAIATTNDQIASAAVGSLGLSGFTLLLNKTVGGTGYWIAVGN